MNSLSLLSPAQMRQLVFKTSWDTQVLWEVYPEPLHPKEPTEAPYAHVGGLDAQIIQVRDLIEIPLTRPDIFQHFGTYLSGNSTDTHP
jgi:ATP-dependent 26S proteasome regulatory subunit